MAGAGFTVHRLAVREIPRSGKPDELLDRFGISAAPHRRSSVKSDRRSMVLVPRPGAELPPLLHLVHRLQLRFLVRRQNLPDLARARARAPPPCPPRRRRHRRSSARIVVSSTVSAVTASLSASCAVRARSASAFHSSRCESAMALIWSRCASVRLNLAGQHRQHAHRSARAAIRARRGRRTASHKRTAGAGSYSDPERWRDTSRGRLPPRAMTPTSVEGDDVRVSRSCVATPCI